MVTSIVRASHIKPLCLALQFISTSCSSACHCKLCSSPRNDAQRCIKRRKGIEPDEIQTPWLHRILAKLKYNMLHSETPVRMKIHSFGSSWIRGVSFSSAAGDHPVPTFGVQWPGKTHNLCVGRSRCTLGSTVALKNHRGEHVVGATLTRMRWVPQLLLLKVKKTVNLPHTHMYTMYIYIYIDHIWSALTNSSNNPVHVNRAKRLMIISYIASKQKARTGTANAMEKTIPSNV